MINAKKILGLIPARGGSKRLPGKNVRPLNGVPLIELTIQVSHRSRYIDKTIISTDSAEIAKIAESCGAEVPFLRKKHFPLFLVTTLKTFIPYYVILKNNIILNQRTLLKN